MDQQPLPRSDQTGAGALAVNSGATAVDEHQLR
jgi:hypothetical protein